MGKNVYQIVENAVKRAITENIHAEIDAAWDEFNKKGMDFNEGFDADYIDECISRSLKKSLRSFKLL